MKIKQDFKSFVKINTKEMSKDDAGRGIIKISGWASKSFENGMPVIDRDGENLNSTNFNLSNAKVLLYNHDWDEICGKIKLSHRPEGIWIEAEVHKIMDEKVFYAVEQGIIDSFSVGFTVTEAEYIRVNGEDYISFTKGEILEVSLVSIPANTSALIENTTVIKSITKDGKCTGLQCKVQDLKTMNPDCGCPIEKLKEGDMEKTEEKSLKDIKQIIKALTFEETENGKWRQWDKLDYYISILAETINDNFYESLWSDGIDPEIFKQNILDALTSFGERLNELPVLNAQVEVNKEIKREDMKTKSVENNDQDVNLEGGEPTPNVEQTEEPTTEKVEATEETKEVVEENQVEDNENKETSPTEQSVSKPTVSTVISAIQAIDLKVLPDNLADLSDDELRELYDSASEVADIVEKINELVRADLEGGE